jgi:5-methyltetrahydropteroyltriglutamate--homocysteine methyltransferase
MPVGIRGSITKRIARFGGAGYTRAVIAVHTDVVGSLLRPPELLAVRDRFDRGDASAAELKRAEDRAVDAAVRLQEEAGIEVVTDGEMRRLSFQSGLPEAVDGFGRVPLEAYLWGDWHGEEVGDRSTDRPEGLGVREPLRRRRHIAAEDFTYLRGRATAVAKVTLTSPSLYANLWSPTESRDAYATLDAFLEDVAALTRDEIGELARLGCTYIQLDAPHYPLLIDPRTRAFYEAQGWSVDRWLERGIELDNWVMDGHPGVTFGFHLCRGNQGSRWLASGGYEPIARRVFSGVAAHRLLLEYDDERSGSFQPLEHVPDDRMVVLGLVTTKSGRRETAEELEQRIRTAAEHVDIERLAISPQCGFATSVVGNAITTDDQRAKLEVLARTAERVWG